MYKTGDGSTQKAQKTQKTQKKKGACEKEDNTERRTSWPLF